MNLGIEVHKEVEQTCLCTSFCATPFFLPYLTFSLKNRSLVRESSLFENSLPGSDLWAFLSLVLCQQEVMTSRVGSLFPFCTMVYLYITVNVPQTLQPNQFTDYPKFSQMSEHGSQVLEKCCMTVLACLT